MSDFLGRDDAAARIMDAIAEPGDDAPIGGDDAAVDNQPVDRPARHAQDADATPAKPTTPSWADDATAAAEPAPQQAIEPPVSWKAEAKDRFRKLPLDDQKYILERESERDRGLSEAQRKAAEADKLAKARADEVAAERNAYAEKLKQFTSVASDPKFAKLSEYRTRDWEKYAAENPLEYPIEQARWAKAEQAFQSAQAEQRRIEEQAKAERLQRGMETLASHEDTKSFWNDTAKRDAFVNDFKNFVKGYGYTDQELDRMDDPRTILIGRLAMLGKQFLEERRNVSANRKPPSNGRVMRAQAADDNSSNPRADALGKRALRTGKVDDAAAAILAKL